MKLRYSVAVATPLVLLSVVLPAATSTSTDAPWVIQAVAPPVVAMVTPAVMPQPRLPEITWDLPVTRNERVDFWIRWLSRHNKTRTALWLERSGRYVPMTQEKLRARGMPEDLVYLALIESGFSPTATSSAQAIGLWQFIAETGQRYGLKVTPYLDERYDPVKSTDAALRYLKELHGRFGSWYLAAAAYNSGENKVARLLRERAGNARGDEALYWQISPYLPQETRDYVPLMLAAGHIGKEPARYGFRKLAYHAPLTYDTVRVPGNTSLHLVAEACGVDADDVIELNHHFRQRVTPPGRHVNVRIPEGQTPVFESNFARVHRAAHRTTYPSAAVRDRQQAP